jgi:D-3-phosphoglycerate dehydrogenase
LSELTVGLVGYGRIGWLLPGLLAPFGCKLLVHDPYVRVASDAPVNPVALDRLLAESDVSRCTPG